jgi:cyclase
MSLTRREFLKSASLITGGVILSINNIYPKNVFRYNGLRSLRENVGIYTERGGTMGWYVSDDSSLIIDSQFPDTAENFMNLFKEKTSGTIDFLFNTHHHGDHTSGNAYLKEYVERIVAQENCPIFQKLQNEGKENQESLVFADMTFKEQWQRELGKETINARHLGAAHTGGDSIIYFEKANIAHMGDLVFNDVYPFIDLAGGGSITNWIDVLEKAADTYPKDAIFIFGHAADEEKVTGQKSDLLRMRDYLTALLDFTKKHIDDAADIEEAKKVEFIPGFEGRKANWEEALAGNIQAAFNELTGKKVTY